MALVVTAGAGENIEADLQLKTLKIGVVKGSTAFPQVLGSAGGRWAQ